MEVVDIWFYNLICNLSQIIARVFAKVAFVIHGEKEIRLFFSFFFPLFLMQNKIVIETVWVRPTVLDQECAFLFLSNTLHKCLCRPVSEFRYIFLKNKSFLEVKLISCLVAN